MKIKVAKDHYRINIPAEWCNKLGIKRGEEIELQLEEDKLIIYPITNEEIVIDTKFEEETYEDKLKKLKPLEHVDRFYPSGKRYYERYTPCDLYKFSGTKYMNKHCENCNLDCLKYQTEETKLLCPKYNKSNSNKEKKEEINNEISYTKEDIKRFEEISKNTIGFLNSNMSQELLSKLSKQIECGICSTTLKDGEHLIFNDKFICNNCKKDKLNELKELIKFNQRRK